MTYQSMLEKDLTDPRALYRYMKSYEYLYKFWENQKNSRYVSNEELRDRLNYLLKNKIKQRDEISTICWILGEKDVRIEE